MHFFYRFFHNCNHMLKLKLQMKLCSCPLESMYCLKKCPGVHYLISEETVSACVREQWEKKTALPACPLLILFHIHHLDGDGSKKHAPIAPAATSHCLFVAQCVEETVLCCIVNLAPRDTEGVPLSWFQLITDHLPLVNYCPSLGCRRRKEALPSHVRCKLMLLLATELHTMDAPSAHCVFTKHSGEHVIEAHVSVEKISVEILN